MDSCEAMEIIDKLNQEHDDTIIRNIELEKEIRNCKIKCEKEVSGMKLYNKRMNLKFKHFQTDQEVIGDDKVRYIKRLRYLEERLLFVEKNRIDDKRLIGALFKKVNRLRYLEERLLFFEGQKKEDDGVISELFKKVKQLSKAIELIT